VGFLEGIHINGSRLDDVLVSHLLFAGDTLILRNLEVSQLGYLRCIIVLFEMMSGLKINLCKSVFIPFGEVPELNNLAQLFDCGVDSLPSSYLGLPLGASFKSKVVLETIVERFRKKLAGWKSILLSRRGRLTLLKSSLWSLPIYFMSPFTIPVSVARGLEKIMRDFPWLNNGSTKGLHWVNWGGILSSEATGRPRY